MEKSLSEKLPYIDFAIEKNPQMHRVQGTPRENIYKDNLIVEEDDSLHSSFFSYFHIPSLFYSFFIHFTIPSFTLFYLLLHSHLHFLLHTLLHHSSLVTSFFLTSTFLPSLFSTQLHSFSHPLSFLHSFSLFPTPPSLSFPSHFFKHPHFSFYFLHLPHSFSTTLTLPHSSLILFSLSLFQLPSLLHFIFNFHSHPPLSFTLFTSTSRLLLYLIACPTFLTSPTFHPLIHTISP